MTRQRRSSGVSPLPEYIQSNMRKNLRMARESRGKQKADVKTLSPSSLRTYEVHDISTMRLGDIYNLALEYDMQPAEFINFLFHGVPEENESIFTETMERIALHLNGLIEEDQKLACSVVQQISESSKKRETKIVSEQIV